MKNCPDCLEFPADDEEGELLEGSLKSLPY